VKTISKMLGHYQQTKNLMVSYSPRRSDSSEPASIACGKPAACDFTEQTMVARVEVTRLKNDREAENHARSADVSSVRRMLRWQCADVLSGQ
jgi:hypothetical protein